MKHIIKPFFLLLPILLPGFFTGCFKNTGSSPDNYKTAMFWSLRSADSGSVSARKMLGAMYYLGDGVPKDLKIAYMWYKLAADQGDPSAKTFLSMITQLLSENELSEAQMLFSEKQKTIHSSD